MGRNVNRPMISQVVHWLLMVIFSFPGQAIAQFFENDLHSGGTGVWSPEIDACIPYQNNLVIDGLSFGTCKALCEAQMEFVCRSVEYYSRTRQCQLSTATSSSPSFRQPCHFNGWIFTEIGHGHGHGHVSVSCPQPFCNCGRSQIIDWVVSPDGCNSCRCIGIRPPCPSPICNCKLSQNVETFVNENGCEICRCVPKARWTRGTNACIRGKGNLSLNDLSLDDCKDQCQAHFVFDCKSIEYQSSSRRCWLNTETSTSSSYIQPCHNRGWTFTEVIDECRDNWPQSAVGPVTLCDSRRNNQGCYRSCTDAQANGGCQNWIANDVCRKTCGICNNAEPRFLFDFCPRGYEEVLNQCLNIDDSDSQTWLQASFECRRSGGYLATAKNPRKLSAFILRNYPRKTFWIGGSDEEREGRWVWESGKRVGRNFPWGKNNQGRQNPENAKNNEDCMALKFFRARRGNRRRTVYVDNRCSIRHHHICEADKR